MTLRCGGIVFAGAMGMPWLAVAAPGEFVEDEVALVWHLRGQEGSQFGWAIADLEDLDGDGAADVLIGAPRHDAGDGQAGLLLAVSGRTGSELLRFEGLPGEQLGYAMADAGDVDGDGLHDIVVGAPTAGGSGRVYVYAADDGATLHALEGVDAGDAFGSAVASAGDVDGDGLADVLVGAEGVDLEGEIVDAGRAYVFAGADGASIRTLDGPGAGARFGSGAAWVGDVDGDGVDDPFVGARDAGDEQGGAAYLFSGATGEPLLDLVGGPDSGDQGWFFVATVGDLDGDRVPDLYVGDFTASVMGPSSGRVRVLSGADGDVLFEQVGDGPGEGLGPGRGAGDVDDDGVPDVVAGAYASSEGATGAGRVFLFDGDNGAVLRTITSAHPGEQFGFDAVGVGDVDDDGRVDVVVSAAADDNVYMISGAEPEPTGGSEGSDTGEPPPGSTGADESDSGAETAAPGTETGAPTTSETTGAAIDDDTDGCGCTVSPGLGWWWLVVGLGLRRRRQGTSSGA